MLKPRRSQPKLSAKKAKPQGTDTMPANDQALEVIQKSETGVDNVTIAKQTGLNAEPEKMKTETPQKKATKKAKPQAPKAMPATDQVLEVIQKSKTGVDNVTISKQTGLNQKQVSSALLRLKKYGKIKSVRTGCSHGSLIVSVFLLQRFFDFRGGTLWQPALVCSRPDRQESIMLQQNYAGGGHTQ